MSGFFSERTRALMNALARTRANITNDKRLPRAPAIARAAVMRAFEKGRGSSIPQPVASLAPYFPAQDLQATTEGPHPSHGRGWRKRLSGAYAAMAGDKPKVRMPFALRPNMVMEAWDRLYNRMLQRYDRR